MRGKKFLVGTLAMSLALAVALGGVLAIKTNFNSNAGFFEKTIKYEDGMDVSNFKSGTVLEMPSSECEMSYEEQVQEEETGVKEAYEVINDAVKGNLTGFVVDAIWQYAKKKSNDVITIKGVKSNFDAKKRTITTTQSIHYNKGKNGTQSTVIINAQPIIPKSPHRQELKKVLADVSFQVDAGALNQGEDVTVVVYELDKVEGKGAKRKLTIGKKVLDETIYTGTLNTFGCDRAYFTIKKKSKFGKYVVMFGKSKKSIKIKHQIQYCDGSEYVVKKQDNHLAY